MPWCPAVRVIYKPSLCEFYFVILLRFLQKDSFEMLKLLIKSSSDSQLKSLMELYIIPLLGRLYLPCSRHGIRLNITFISFSFIFVLRSLSAMHLMSILGNLHKVGDWSSGFCLPSFFKVLWIIYLFIFW